MTSQELLDLIEKHKVNKKIYLFQYAGGLDDDFTALFRHTKGTNLRVVGEALKLQSYSFVNSADDIKEEGVYECTLLRKGINDDTVYAFVWWDRRGTQRGRVVSVRDTVENIIDCMEDFLERKDS